MAEKLTQSPMMSNDVKKILKVWMSCLLSIKVPFPVRLLPSILSTLRPQLALTALNSKVSVWSSRAQ